MRFKFFFLLVLALLETSCATRNVASTSSEGNVADIKSQILAIQTKAAMPGLQVRVSEDDKTIFEVVNGLRAVGHTESVTSTDQWHIGSCTKPMTAFLVGRLIDQGRVKWTSTLKDIVPAKMKLHPSLKTVTVEQLLSHQAGLADVVKLQGGKLWPTLFQDRSKTVETRNRLVEGILTSPAVFTPGSKTEYSNADYVILGWIVEHFSAKTWEQVMQNEIFEPLAMNSCGFGPAGSENQKTPTQPWPHVVQNQKLEAIPPGIFADNPAALGPAGTVHCNVEDWHKFLRFYFDNQAVKSGFVKQATYDKLLSQPASSDYTYSTVGRMERSWAKGLVFTMAGSNTYNYAIMAVTPATKRVYTINTNAGAVDAAVIDILKLLTTIK